MTTLPTLLPAGASQFEGASNITKSESAASLVNILNQVNTALIGLDSAATSAAVAVAAAQATADGAVSDAATAQGAADAAQSTADLNAGAITALQSIPLLDWVDGAVPAAGTIDIVLYGTGLTGGGTFDELVLTESAASVTITALKPGDTGYSVVLNAPADNGGNVVLDWTNGVLTITPDLILATDDAIATAINADAAAVNGVLRANSAGGGSFAQAQQSQDLINGTGDYAETLLTISGVEALPINETGTTTTAKWSDTKIEFTTANLTAESPARAAGDTVAIRVKANNLRSAPLGTILT